LSKPSTGVIRFKGRISASLFDELIERLVSETEAKAKTQGQAKPPSR